MKRFRRVVIIGSVLILFLIVAIVIYKNKFSADSVGDDITFYKTNLAGENKAKVRSLAINLPKGETESFVLELKHLGSDTHNSLATRTDLKQGAKEFPRSNIDDRVIYNWKQKKIDITRQNRPEFANLDELLVKTNKINYLDPSITKTSLPTSFGFRNSLENSDQTDFKFINNKVKLYYKITAPENSGAYQGKIEVFDKDKNLVVGTVNIQVKVIDEKLPQLNDYTFGCFTNDRIRESNSGFLSPNTKGYNVTEQQYVKRLAELRKLGCNALVVRMNTESKNIQMIKAIQRSGFTKGILIDFRFIDDFGLEQKFVTLDDDGLYGDRPEIQFQRIVREILSEKENIRMPISFYGIDEPNSRNNTLPQSYDNYKKQASNIKRIFNQVVNEEFGGDSGTFRGDVTAAMVSDTYLDLLAEEDSLYYTESPILHYFYDCATHRIDGMECRDGSVSMKNLLDSYKDGSRSVPANPMYYFQSTYEDSKSNRYFGGLALASSGIKGYYLNAVYGFNDRKEKGSPLFSEDNYLGDKNQNRLTYDKENMMFYPAVDGLIPTVQSESIREGMMDLKYYLAYKEIVKKIDKCSIVNRPIINNLVWKVEASRRNAPDEFSASDIYSNGYNLPTKSVEKFRTNLENLFFQFASKCE